MWVINITQEKLKTLKNQLISLLLNAIFHHVD